MSEQEDLKHCVYCEKEIENISGRWSCDYCENVLMEEGKKLKVKDGVMKLKKIRKKYKDDPEVMHIEADDIIREFLPHEIREEYERLENEVGFWYS